MSLRSEIIRKAQTHVRALFKNQHTFPGLYHNFDHTMEVVNNASEIAEASNLTRADTEVVVLAAWFHDTGFLESPADHEERSARIAAEFLKGHNYPAVQIDRVAACIRATRLPQSPKNLIEQIMCDADLLHLGKKESFQKGELLRAELETMSNRRMSEEEWLTQSIGFFKGHSYHTPYAITEYSDRRDRNLRKLEKRLRKLELHRPAHEERPAKNERKGKKSGRSAETMFRIASQNYMVLRSIADNKANIMIGVPSIIIAIVITVLPRKIYESPELLIPAIMLMLTCVATIVFAILSARTKETSGRFPKEESSEMKFNLFLFGNVYDTKYDDYLKGMKELVNDKDLLYSALIKEIYYLGQILRTKHRCLRISFDVFLFGLAASVFAFLIAVGFYSGKL